ncbi:MAG: alpha/beta hydrolase [Gemmatimonadetes bacterium]|nr:alpha/beta hydrolase [Gemmatimonadota bacterium]
MASTRLAPAEWYPAGWPGVSARHIVLADGTKVRVVESGPESAPPVLLLHGWAVSAYLWRHTIGALAAAGWRAVAIDLPGHGLSDAPTERGEYTLVKFTDRCAALLDSLGVARAPILAQSMGGRIGVELAIRKRASRLLLFGPVGFGHVSPATAYAPFIPPALGEIAVALVTRPMVELVQRRVHGKLGWFTDRDVDEYWAPTQFADVVRAQLQMLREFSWQPLTPDELYAIGVPTLVIFGTGDQTVKPLQAAQLAAELPDGQLEWVEGGGHVLMEEIPERINSRVIEFLGSPRG